ncbi:MAG: polysaccharide pyruvyl transferase family protein [Rhodobacterales bacterium]|nr:polysaccharide pyruvyl transferase family protein [Rhodobacterales bacterium]NCT11448.1 polysaccharide pyruvyl transferase family protein [Rhodobacterales bacterium]
MTRTAVILNDTSHRYHHGCARVMTNLVAGLTAQGFDLYRIPARTDWSANAAHRHAIAGAALVVINGEGTLHDGAPAGARLLAATEATAAPVALVNALWQDNPPEWSPLLARCALIAARDSASAAAMASATGRAVRWLPDLSLATPATITDLPRNGLVLGDSVRAAPRKALARAAQRLGAEYLPTKTLQAPIWRSQTARALLWRAYTGVWSGPVPRFEMARDTAAYLARLSAAAGHVTGRYHGVCLSLLSGTPVLAVASVTSKVQGLLADAGLGDARLLTPQALDALTPATALRPYDSAERAAIQDFLTRAQDGAARLFADLGALA